MSQPLPPGEQSVADGTIDLYETIRPLVTGDPRTRLKIRVERGQLRFRGAGLAAPLTARGDVIGVLTVTSDELDAFDDAHEEGVQALARFSVHQLVQAAKLEQAERLTQIVSVQNRFNLEDRRSDGVLEYCAGKSMAFIPWAPLGYGRHTGQSGSVRALAKFAQRHHVSVGSAAIAWLLHHSKAMLPIPGTGSVEHLEENVGAAGLKLTAEDLRELG